jgi:signal transduction histidine kinase
LKIVRQYDVAQAFAAVDGDRMKQVFWNLLENAVRAMHQEGTINVFVRAVGESWLVGIGDTGPGVPAKMMDKIFEPFQSQFEGGTGLGLAIVYQIVQAHGAKIWVQTAAGGGAEFVLEILNARAAALLAPAMAGSGVEEAAHG